MFDLTGRVALVTGGGQHIGQAIAECLAMRGATVAVNDVVADRAEAVASRIAESGGRAVAAPADVTDLEDLRRCIEGIRSDHGPVDILVSNAGNAGTAQYDLTPFREMPPESWAKFVDVNTYGVLNGIHCVLDGMCERGWGRIITISSDAGRTGTPMGTSVYGGAKAGAVGFQRHLALEVGRYGVTVNTVSLGMIPHGWDAGEPRHVPMRRWGQDEDVGPAVLYFASDEAGWVTGQSLSVNGGVLQN